MRFAGRSREFEQPPKAADVDHVGVKGGLTGSVETCVAVATGEAKEGIDLPHASPGEMALEESRGIAADSFTMTAGLAGEEGYVTEGIGGFVCGKVATVCGSSPWWHPRVRLDQCATPVSYTHLTLPTILRV